MTSRQINPTIEPVSGRRPSLTALCRRFAGGSYSKIWWLVIVLLLFLGNTLPSKAQSAFFWSEQKKIPSYYQIAQQPPYMVAGLDHTVHAFNSQPVDLVSESSSKALFYRQWTQNGGWTEPNDIIVDDLGGDVEVVDVTSDSSGMVYLLYQKEFQNLYFTSANLSEAGKSTAWSEPVRIATQVHHVSTGFEGVASIAADEQGDLVVIYSGQESGAGLYSTYSFDSGNNWSQSYPVYLAADGSMVVTDPDLVVGESGMVHAVWTTFMSSGAGGPGYYANFDVKNSVWSEPMALDVPGIRTPSVIEYKNDIFVSYYHASTNGNWWRRSSDGGVTWTDPSQLSPNHVGTNGRVSFVVDSANTLYGFFGERINDLNHGMWQITWGAGMWSAPAPVVKGPQFKDVQGGFGFDPASARAVIVNGNLILVTWATDGFAGVNGAWFSYKMLESPELAGPAEQVPTPTLSVSATDTPSAVSTVEVTVTPVASPLDFDRRAPFLLFNAQTSIVAGVGFALVLVVGILIISIVVRSRRH